MTKEELLTVFKKSLGKKDVLNLAQLAAAHPGFIKQLIDISFYPQQEIAFRSAWVLEHCAMSSPAYMEQNLDFFIEVYPLQENLSCKRHFTKLLMCFSQAKYLDLIKQADLNPVIEATFEWLINPQTPVAVQANCLDILYNLRSEADWIESELKAQVMFLLKGGTAAIQSRGKKVLQQLEKRH